MKFKNKKKVIHLIYGLAIGGAETALLRLIPLLKENEIDSEVWYFTNDETQLQNFLDKKIKMRRFRSTLVIPLFLFFKRNEVDWVISWMYRPSFICVLSKFINPKLKIALNIRRSMTDLKKMRFRARLSFIYAKILSRFFDALIFNSKSGLKSHEIIGFKNANTVLIPNSFENFNEQEKIEIKKRGVENLKKLGIAKGTPVFVYAGRNHPHKNILMLFESIKLFFEKGLDAHFVVMGLGLGKEFSLDSYNLGEKISRVHLLGRIFDPKPWFSVAHGFLLTSETEGFSNALGEAMSFGAVPIVTDVGDNGWLVNDQVGYLVESNDSDHFANALGQCVKLSVAEHENKSKNAAEVIAREFTYEKLVQSYLSVMQK
ncbi:MAG: hypothetical protein CL678_07640 [Bdellovibrionaceae bacterium]|nr:hypothetical protein [Pseudobdellovibrionaceae bacterium]|tara:strand:- start:2226 stop:3344 length:1119 start_codon:yes stop_codon:yes gene_type:complete